MAGTYANITPTTIVDGLPYATAKTLPTTEADLWNQTVGQDPVPVLYGSAVVAVVKFTVTGTPDATNAYVVMETDLFGDGNWIDVAWVRSAITSGTETVVLSGGDAGALASRQSRVSNSAPSTSSGAIQIPLGGRIRFTGKVAFTNGTSPVCSVGITYKLLGLR